MKVSDITFTFGRIFSDALMILASLFLTYYLRMHQYQWLGLVDPLPYPFWEFAQSAVNITGFLLIVFSLQGRYHFKSTEKFFEEITHLFWSYSSGLALILVAFFFLQKFFFSRFAFGILWVIGLLCLIFGRAMIRMIRGFFHRCGVGRTRILILGTRRMAARMADTILQQKQYQLIGALSEDPTDQKTFKGVDILGSFKDFESLVDTHTPDEVLLALEDSTVKIETDHVRKCYMQGIQFRYIPDELGLDLADVKTSTIGNTPIITLHNTHLDGWGLLMKSVFDFCASVVLILLTSPILLSVGFLVWWGDKKAPIIYTSTRVGKNGRLFPCFKFRTMIPDADKKKAELLTKNERKGGVLFKIEKDPRITKIGHFLRKTSLDEFPQLFNVLRGEMSLIGPRPHLPEEVKKYGKNDLRVLAIRPGMSGFSQINGRSTLSFEDEMKYELFYIQNWSLWLDIIIFFKTLWIVVKRKDVS